MKLLLGLTAALLLLPVSCDVEDLANGTIIFYNFSPLTVTELKVYDSIEAEESSKYKPAYEKKDLLYTYAGGIKSGKDHRFVLPENYEEYIFEVRTEEAGVDEPYEGGRFGSFGTTHIVFSVDYDVLEYDL
jgi:hypothetical protein